MSSFENILLAEASTFNSAGLRMSGSSLSLSSQWGVRALLETACMGGGWKWSPEGSVGVQQLEATGGRASQHRDHREKAGAGGQEGSAAHTGHTGTGSGKTDEAGPPSTGRPARTGGTRAVRCQSANFTQRAHLKQLCCTVRQDSVQAACRLH